MTARAQVASVAVTPRRALSEHEAAIYVGVSETTFRNLCKSGDMPRPRKIGSRNVWDIRDLDLAFDRLPGGEATNPWDRTR